MMKLIIFGATGATGQLLIKQALVAGNQVVAFARNPSKIEAGSEHLTIVQGELTVTAAIERAVSGAEAVISVSGSRPGENLHSKLLSKGIQNILEANDR
jgi:putative NADH-flavin reductase